MTRDQANRIIEESSFDPHFEIRRSHELDYPDWSLSPKKEADIRVASEKEEITLNDTTQMLHQMADLRSKIECMEAEVRLLERDFYNATTITV